MGSTFHGSCRAPMSLVPLPCLWSPLPNRPGGIPPSLHTAEPPLIFSSQHPPFTLCYAAASPSQVWLWTNSVDPGVEYTGIMKQFSWLFHFLFRLTSFFIKVGREKLTQPEEDGTGPCFSYVPNRLKPAWPDVPFCHHPSPHAPCLHRILNKVQSQSSTWAWQKKLDGISGKYFNSSCMITLPPQAAQDPHMAQHF